RAPERCGDEDEEDDVARRVADRQPERVEPAFIDETGDAQEARSGEVFAADRARVAGRADEAGRDVEVARGPRQPQTEGAHGQGDETDQDDRRDGEHVDAAVRHDRLLTSSVKSASMRVARRT